MRHLSDAHWLQQNDSLRRDNPFLWYLTLLGPFLLTVAIIATLYLLHGWPYVRGLLLSALAVFFFFGRFVILGGNATDGLEDAARFFSPGELALLVFYMDAMVASLLAFHIGFLFRLPFFGDHLRLLVEDGRFILHAHPWMKRATFIGIVAFVTFPLAATGSVGGSIFGRLLGMTRAATFLGVITGSLVGCSVMYFGASLINHYLDRNNPWLTMGGILFVVAITLVLNFRYRHIKNQWQQHYGNK
ncbi:small multi-drug export protein [Desulfurivibrio dismutans]|uniref:small multi-drug export protein n=1 Tax=Desulfurivibrio dismutans TaxID=1398908 RepID=UPI0023DAF27E|nr:small multi-drug export protein [Desulfurivibrio alkaliphilus]MDF1615548.1 small multi-drug export protein [Desulfurivibrio alkaliphilus]